MTDRPAWAGSMMAPGQPAVSTPGCDVCGAPATVIRPPTASRELAFYCDDHAAMFLGWGDTYHELAGLTEIARMAGVRLNTVSNWRSRWADFPEPQWQLACGPVWRASVIRTYLAKKGRLK